MGRREEPEVKYDPTALYLATHLRVSPHQAQRLIDEAHKAVADLWRPLFVGNPAYPPRKAKSTTR